MEKLARLCWLYCQLQARNEQNSYFRAEINCQQKTQATLQSANQPSKIYYGCGETEYKTRFNNHKQSFKDSDERCATVLSRAVWRVKDRGEEPQITWNIHARAPAYQGGSKLWQLCTAKKLEIIRAESTSLPNKQSEITGKCRHKTNLNSET